MKFRGSSYNIAVKLTDEESLLIHGYTGAIKKVSKDTLAWLRSLDNQTIDESTTFTVPTENLIAELKRGGFLTEMAHAKENDFISEICRNIHKRRLRSMPEYMIIPTYGCNFDCFYCFEKEMRTCRGDDFVNGVISRDMCDRIFKIFEKIETPFPPEKINKDNPIHITFYGGEPLQRSTKEIVTYIINTLKLLNKYSFSAITNGYDLEYFRELLSPEILNKLQITLDSIPAIHNKQRTLKHSNLETFSKIAENIGMALNRGVEVNLRINTDRETIISLEKLTDEIDKRGWNGYKNFTTTIAPIYRLKNQTGYDKCMNCGELFNEFKKISDKLPGDKTFKMSVSMENYFSSMKMFVKNNRPLIPFFKSSICNSMGTLLIFDPTGDVYPCFERVGIKDSVIGNISSNGYLEINEDVFNKWRGRLSTTNPVCSCCIYAMFCGGGCASRAEEINGTINSSHCDGFPLLFHSKMREMYFENDEK